jgi:hypothetical protein
VTREQDAFTKEICRQYGRAAVSTPDSNGAVEVTALLDDIDMGKWLVSPDGKVTDLRVMQQPQEIVRQAVKALQEVRELLHTRSGTPRRCTLPAILRADAAIDALIGGR